MQPGFWSVEDRLRELSAQSDPLEKLLEIVDFELFRPVLDDTLGGTDKAKGGQPPFDAVLKLKMLYLQAQHGLSFEATEHLVRDRLPRRCLLTAAPSGMDRRAAARDGCGFAACPWPTRCRMPTPFGISARR
jgi:hypothetical protein